MNIIFIGMRVTGKTTLSKLLAKKIGWQQIEVDELIEKNSGKPIARIVKDNGWNEFRRIEKKIVAEVSLLNKVVISAGGGVVTDSENIKNLKQNGLFIWLTAPSEVVYNRIKSDINRPLLTNANSLKEDIEQTLKSRFETYQSASDITIQTTDTPHKNLAEIMVHLQKVSIV